LSITDSEDEIDAGDPDVEEPEDGGPETDGEPLSLTVAEGDRGERLDKLLAGGLDGLSRSRIRALIDQGRVSSLGATITDASMRVKPGQTFHIAVPEPEAAVPVPQDIPLAIAYEDDDLLVIDKAAGMVVHPAAGNADGTLVNALLWHCGDRLSGIGGVRRPGIVHRLDKDTSGLMVVAKNDLAHQALAAQFADRSLSRTYQAVVFGVPSPAKGEIEGNIGRSSSDRKKMAVVSGGKTALTRYRVLRSFGTAASLVECVLATGRTHQIRVHMTHVGHPLVGDPVYGIRRSGGPAGRGNVGGNAGGSAGNAKQCVVTEQVRGALVGFPRQALHAVALRFNHPRDARQMQFESELPLDIHALIESLESI
jgi:23S rRNA pseudouridine1911/1915/1917 synthase